MITEVENKGLLVNTTLTFLLKKQRQTEKSERLEHMKKVFVNNGVHT